MAVALLVAQRKVRLGRVGLDVGANRRFDRIERPSRIAGRTIGQLKDLRQGEDPGKKPIVKCDTRVAAVGDEAARARTTAVRLCRATFTGHLPSLFVL
jgi:hypothetical protein